MDYENVVYSNVILFYNQIILYGVHVGNGKLDTNHVWGDAFSKEKQDIGKMKLEMANTEGRRIHTGNSVREIVKWRP